MGNGRLVNKLISIQYDKCYYRYTWDSEEVETRFLHMELIGFHSVRWEPLENFAWRSDIVSHI